MIVLEPFKMAQPVRSALVSSQLSKLKPNFALRPSVLMHASPLVLLYSYADAASVDVEPRSPLGAHSVPWTRCCPRNARNPGRARPPRRPRRLKQHTLHPTRGREASRYPPWWRGSTSTPSRRWRRGGRASPPLAPVGPPTSPRTRNPRHQRTTHTTNTLFIEPPSSSASRPIVFRASRARVPVLP